MLAFIFFITVAVCIAASLGVTVGLGTRRADLGLATTGGTAAVVGCVEAFLFWKYK